ncbi:MAG: hypothetical protein V7749_08130 [Cocleimonas sp.]
MQNRRLLFTVIIKLLVISGLLLLVVVLFNSLFVKTVSVPRNLNDVLPLVELEIAEMRKGEIRKTRWNNKEVAILLRQFPERLTQELTQQSTESTKEDIHPSIKQQIRSKKIEYFVFFNTGDSRNCPLYHSGGEFKDVCSSNRFNEMGRDLNVKQQGHMIEIPPHYFKHNVVVFGKWQVE